MKEEKEKPTIVKEPDLSGTYTATDYLQWKLDELVELIRGKVVKMTPAPSSNHQSISLELTLQIGNFFRDHSCHVFTAPFDVYLIQPGQTLKDATNIVEPDICVICDRSKIRQKGCLGAPDFIVEILSPNTAHKDQKDKFELYEEFGVREYWIVFPENRSVIVNVLEDGQYRTQRPVTSAENLRSVIFPKLEVDLEQVFRNVTD